VREIEKTAESVRKKHRALKTGKIEEGIAAKSHFKLIIEPLQKIDDSSMRAIKDEPCDVKTLFVQKTVIRSKMKRKREDTLVDHALSKSHKLMRHTSNDVMNSPAITSTRMTIEAVKSIKDEDVFETTNDSFDFCSTSDANVEKRCRNIWVRWVKSTSEISSAVVEKIKL